uniref:Uncharacterized protein n=1 Tax=Anguilla anguilla TaxID=7936 RepID=A0A0E9Q1D1_ANGAN
MMREYLLTSSVHMKLIYARKHWKEQILIKHIVTDFSQINIISPYIHSDHHKNT